MKNWTDLLCPLPPCAFVPEHLLHSFADTNPTSDNYGNFTISTDLLNLYNAEEGVSTKLSRIQGDANDVNADDTSKCKGVLNNLFSACNPDDATCTEPNHQSFALSTEQVCDAVNTRKKLLFEAIGDEFDGFSEKFSPGKHCDPYAFCLNPH